MLPLLSLIVTSAPASAIPEIALPLVGLTIGATGGLLSTVVVAAWLTLPAASVATTRSTVPSAGMLTGVTL